MGTGATTTGLTKTVSLGTGGASGSNTVVNIGPATSGANGTMVVNTPTVTFANAVTQVGMPQANLTAQLLGLGGATADSYNRLSVNTPAVLLNNAGAGIEATVNKAAAGNDAAFAFKTGFSARALIGLLGSDDFSCKVSPDGSAFYEALRIDRASGRVEMPEPVVLPALDVVPTPPPTGKLAVYARDRAGAGWLDVQRPSGRFFPLQPHFGVNRIATWAPSTGTTVSTNGMPRTAVGTVSTPTLATTNLSTSMRRWRVTSAATADAAAEERSAGWVCWRGNADGLGGFHLCEPAFAGDAAGDRNGLLRPLRIDNSAGDDPAGKRHFGSCRPPGSGFGDRPTLVWETFRVVGRHPLTARKAPDMTATRGMAPDLAQEPCLSTVGRRASRADEPAYL